MGEVAGVRLDDAPDYFLWKLPCLFPNAPLRP
jgi:hypothetical protein